MSIADLPPTAPGGTDVGDDFTGTNSEKIDKLIGRVMEMRATLRSIYLIAVLFVPSIIGLFGYLVIHGHSLALRVERQAEKIEQVERQQRETNDLLRQLLARPPGK